MDSERERERERLKILQLISRDLLELEMYDAIASVVAKASIWRSSSDKKRKEEKTNAASDQLHFSWTGLRRRAGWRTPPRHAVLRRGTIVFLEGDRAKTIEHARRGISTWLRDFAERFSELLYPLFAL